MKITDFKFYKPQEKVYAIQFTVQEVDVLAVEELKKRVLDMLFEIISAMGYNIPKTETNECFKIVNFDIFDNEMILCTVTIKDIYEKQRST